MPLPNYYFRRNCMNDNEMQAVFQKLKEYLDKEKVFIENPFKMQNVRRAVEILHELFPDIEINIENDPLQMGALIISFTAFDVLVRGAQELDLFAEFTTLVDNFEIYAVTRESVHFAAVIQQALIRI